MLKNFYKAFQQKLPLEIFEKNFSAFISDDIKKRESLTEKKGVRSACDEISALLGLAKCYRASHLKWTGNHTLDYPFDGILYFNKTNKQKIEISRVLDEQANQKLQEPGYFSRNFTIKGPNFNIEPEQDIEYTDTKNFIYHRIVNILEKKSKQKYKGFWLAIAYYPYFTTSKLNEEYVRKPVLKKIECEEKALLFKIRKFFKKIIFVPSGIHFIKITGNTYKIFEWE